MRAPYAGVFVAALASFLALVPAARAGAPPVREITPIAGELYRASNGNWHTVFLVTPSGIVLGDPINTAFATWLKGELDSRFHQPVKYVVYSHSHFDHARGGAVFRDTALFIGHENMLPNLDGRYPHMPGDMIDRNANGVIDPEEIDIPTQAAPGICGMGAGFFAANDSNGDGRIPPAEFQQEIVRPDIVYATRMRIEFGGQVIELVHPGRNHSDDATVMLFPAQRVLFATEFLSDALVRDNPRSLPSACGAFDGMPLAEWIQSYRAVEALDFDTVAPGHGALFPKAVVADTRGFFEDLVREVSAGMAQGRSLEELQETVDLTRYRDWANFERLRSRNIRAAYENLERYR